VAFSPDFNASTGTGLIAIADNGNSSVVVVFSYTPGTPSTLAKQASSSSGLSIPYSVAFSPDFNATTGTGLIAIASYNSRSVVVFSYTAGTPTGTLTKQASSSSGLSDPRSVAFSPDFNATTGAGLIAIASSGNSSVVVFS
jgi:hypothetical protein